MLKELGAKWLVQMAEYFERNPHIIVNGFFRAGVAAALDHSSDDGNEHVSDNSDSESDFDFEDSESEGDIDIEDEY